MSRIEHEEHPDRAVVTAAHRVMRRWAEERGAVSATAADAEHGACPGVPEFDFPGGGGSGLARIGWESWLHTFDQRELEFSHREGLENGFPGDLLRPRERDDG